MFDTHVLLVCLLVIESPKSKCHSCPLVDGVLMALFDSSCAEAYGEVFSDDTETDVCVLGHEGRRLRCAAKGTGGLDAIVKAFTDDSVLYVTIHLSERDELRPRLRVTSVKKSRARAGRTTTLETRAGVGVTSGGSVSIKAQSRRFFAAKDERTAIKNGMWRPDATGDTNKRLRFGREVQQAQARIVRRRVTGWGTWYRPWGFLRANEVYDTLYRVSRPSCDTQIRKARSPFRFVRSSNKCTTTRRRKRVYPTPHCPRSALATACGLGGGTVFVLPNASRIGGTTTGSAMPGGE